VSALVEPGPPERRKYPRGPAPDTLHVTLPVVLDVDIVDLSENGLLFRSRASVAVGQRLQVRTVLGEEPFVSWVEVVRVDPSRANGNGPRFSVGAVFTSREGESARRLKQFLSR
jgi:hypothetical protein